MGQGEWVYSMRASDRSYAIALHENIKAIERWRDGLPESKRRRLNTAQSVVKRWRQSTQPEKEVRAPNLQREALAHFRQFRACLDRMPPETALVCLAAHRGADAADRALNDSTPFPESTQTLHVGIRPREKSLMTNTKSEQKLDRKLRRLHEQRARLAALGLDSVQPPPIVNRRTGETTTFGQRRAYDGAWIIEMLGASGCTYSDVEATIFVLEALIEHEDKHGWKVDKDLLGLLKYFHEPVPPEQLRQMWADHNRSEFRVVE
jgi:hypothetical protein